MRKLMITTTLAGLLLAAIAVAGLAAVGPRLDGTFNVTGTVQDSDFVPAVPPGTKITDTYKFVSTCGSGECAKVKLTRTSGGRNVKSTLKRLKPGVYKGKEGPAPYTCVAPIGNPGQFTGVNKVKVTKSSNGRATKFTGTSKIKFTGCTETFENSKVTGKK
jgi:hypothetical protein